MAAATSAKEATDAALSILDQGGSAADAYLAAALTQTVVEVGLTSLAGAFQCIFFNAATQETTQLIARLASDRRTL